VDNIVIEEVFFQRARRVDHAQRRLQLDGVIEFF
jgi:hypothetical protein